MTYKIFVESSKLNIPKLSKKQLHLFDKICQFKDEGLTFKQISNKLNKLGIPPTRGKVGEFTPQKVWSNYTKIKKNLDREDNFSDRLTLFLLHFSFFLKNYKNEENKKILQEIYDFNFRQLELSIREIGYGDQSINKKMKNYINLIHSMVSDIHFWEKLTKNEKLDKISNFLGDFNNSEYLLVYFEKYNEELSKKTLNFHLKGVINR